MAEEKNGVPIELNYARKLVDNYQKTKVGNELPENETRAVWFSKELILQALGLDPGTDTKEITGLRMYLGAYEEQEGYPANPYDYNKLTLVMVQTGQEKTEVQRGDVTEIVYYDIINDLTLPPSYPSGIPSPLPKTCFNEGQLAPPPNEATGLGLMDW